MSESADAWEIYGITWDGDLRLLFSEFEQKPSIHVSSSGEHSVVVHREETEYRFWVTAFSGELRTWRRGPYGELTSLSIGNDGSVGFVTKRSDSLEVVLLDVRGDEVLRSSLREEFRVSGVAASKILLHGKRMLLLQPKQKPIEVATIEGSFVSWVGKEAVALFEGGSDEVQTRAVDCSTGRTLWSAPYSGKRRSSWPSSVEEVDGLLFVHAVVQDSLPLAFGEPTVPNDRIDAYDTESGKRIARWSSRSSLHAGMVMHEGLQRRGDELWLVGSDRFARIDFEDVRNGSDGWSKEDVGPYPDPPLIYVLGQSELSWETGASQDAPPVRVVAAVRREVEGRALVETTRIEEVTFRDVNPIGTKERQDHIWLATTPRVFLRSSSRMDSSEVVLHMAFLANGTLIAAFTESKPLWVVRSSGRDDRPSRGRFACPVEMPRRPMFEHSVVDILQFLWDRWGIRPDDAGQIVLRPRDSDCLLIPALGPNGITREPQGATWFIDVRGTLMEGRNTWTGASARLSDRNPLEGGYMHSGQ